jgi:hypothetical protein
MTPISEGDLRAWSDPDELLSALGKIRDDQNRN